MVTLRQARVKRMLSLRTLAALAGVTPATVLSIEQGKRVPHLGTAQRLAAALEMEPLAIAEFQRAAEAALAGKEAA